MAEVRRKAKGRKADKRGRNKIWCKGYRLSHRREHNKIARLRRHLKRFPADQVALKAIDVCKAAIRGYQD